MTDRKELLSEVLKRVQRNYKQMVEIERLTKELGDACSRNDNESAQMLLKMRGEEMERASEVKAELQLILHAADDNQKKEVESWLKGEGASSGEFEAQKIREFSAQTAQVTKHTIELDRVISSRLAGKDSYYQSSR
ncbi:MAG: hypothetical protein HFG41_12905 [Coprococcus sp.]|nr:hypothetical protein [Coprococcus sp.]